MKEVIIVATIILALLIGTIWSIASNVRDAEVWDRVLKRHYEEARRKHEMKNFNKGFKY